MPVLVAVLEAALRLLPPFMPFITEELWQQVVKYLPASCRQAGSIMVSPYPVADPNLMDGESEELISTLIDIIRIIRNSRTEHNVDLNHVVSAKRSKVTFYEDRSGNISQDDLVSVLKNADVAISLRSMVDVEKQTERLNRDIVELQAGVARLQQRLADEKF